MYVLFATIFWYVGLSAMQPGVVQQGTMPYPVVIFSNAPSATAQAGAQGVNSAPIITTVTQQANNAQSIAFDKIPALYNTCIQYLKENWVTCSLVTLAALYAALVTYLLYEDYALHQLYYWSMWQKHETMESLMKTPAATLQELLIKNIATQYINQTDPTDALWPLTHFIHAIQHEETRLKQYLSYAALIKQTPFFRILPALQDHYAQEALDRLHFVYHLFTSWSANLTWERLNQRGSYANNAVDTMHHTDSSNG